MPIESNKLRVTSYELPSGFVSDSGVSSSSLVIRNSSPGGFVFWLLILMGLGVFAPCILLPEWREYQAVRAVEQVEQHRLDEMRRFVDRERNLLEGMQSDPGVIARVARRDLHFHHPGETAVAVNVPLVGTATETPFVAPATDMPPVLARTGAYLPSLNYDALFCDPKTRMVLMILSVGVIVTAIALFWQKSPTRS